MSSIWRCFGCHEQGQSAVPPASGGQSPGTQPNLSCSDLCAVDWPKTQAEELGSLPSLGGPVKGQKNHIRDPPSSADPRPPAPEPITPALLLLVSPTSLQPSIPGPTVSCVFLTPHCKNHTVLILPRAGPQDSSAGAEEAETAALSMYLGPEIRPMPQDLCSPGGRVIVTSGFNTQGHQTQRGL